MPSVKDIEEAEQRNERGSEAGEGNKEVIAIRQYGAGVLKNLANEE